MINTNNMKKTLLVIAPGREQVTDSIFYLVVAETGESLCSHFCSNYLFAPNDLYYGRPERIEEFTKRFGEVEVKYIDETDIGEDELIKRNMAWYETLPESEKQ